CHCQREQQADKAARNFMSHLVLLSILDQTIICIILALNGKSIPLSARQVLIFVGIAYSFRWYPAVEVNPSFELNLL
ncbi:MAG TPA: hypothetical protein VFY66_19240, partial [Anaerolineales bacterium]|nr:hypothetical protein [Anaerolineales bacterium]